MIPNILSVIEYNAVVCCGSASLAVARFGFEISSDYHRQLPIPLDFHKNDAVIPLDFHKNSAFIPLDFHKNSAVIPLDFYNF